VTSAAVVWSLAHLLVVLLLQASETTSENIAILLFSPVLPSTRDYPEGSVRLEVRVPSWESHQKVRAPILKDERCERGAEFFFSREDFQRNCETVTLSIVLLQYSTSAQYRATQSLKVRDVSILQLLQYSLYWNWSLTAISTFQHSDSSRQQRPQYWPYRTVSATAIAVLVLRCKHPSVRRPF
jgi:hypothetical protein